MSIDTLDNLRKLLKDDDSGIKHCCGQAGCYDIETDVKQILQALNLYSYWYTAAAYSQSATS